MVKQNFLFDFEKLIDYWVSAVKVVSFNSCVGPLLRIKVSGFFFHIIMDR